MAEIELKFTVNGENKTLVTNPVKTLLSVLRDDLGLKGAKEACGQGDCGTCVVVMDNKAVNSCLVLAGQAQGTSIITVEGLAVNDVLHPLQKAFIDHWAFQCGFCTSGMLMSVYALLLANSKPTAEEVREAISGNLCRCTSYAEIVEAVLSVADGVEPVLRTEVLDAK